MWSWHSHSGCEADGEAGGSGGGELGEAGREVGGANDGMDVDGNETGGEVATAPTEPPPLPKRARKSIQLKL
jgi:hypothetical protein